MISASLFPACSEDQVTQILPGTAPPAPTQVTVSIPLGASALTTNAFGQNPLNISVGTTVTWVNNDNVGHTVTSDTNEFSSSILQPGESFEHTFGEAGTFPYHCEIHPNMVGTIVVNGASPSPSPSPSVEPSPTPTASPSPTPTESPSPTPSPTASPAESPTPTPTAATIEIAIPANATNLGNNAFGQSPRMVPVGTTVTWRNDDTVPHTVTSDAGLFDSGNLDPGQTFTHTFELTGNFPYHCEIHPTMRGRVLVQ